MSPPAWVLDQADGEWHAVPADDLHDDKATAYIALCDLAIPPELSPIRRWASERVLPPPELELRLALAGWEVLTVDFDSPEQAGSAVGAVGCLVARFRGIPVRVIEWAGDAMDTAEPAGVDTGCRPPTTIRSEDVNRP